MDVNPHKFRWKLPWTTKKFLSILYLLQLLIKEIVFHWLLLMSFTNTKKISSESQFSGFKVSRFFCGFVFIRIHEESEDFPISDSLLQCKRLIQRKSLWIAYESGEIWSRVNLALKGYSQSQFSIRRHEDISKPNRLSLSHRGKNDKYLKLRSWGLKSKEKQVRSRNVVVVFNMLMPH